MIEKLMSGLMTLKRTRATTFASVANKIAKGQKLTTEAVDRMLLDCGKEPEQLRDEVERVTRRLQWARQVDDAKPLDEERAAIAGKIADAEHTLEKANEIFETTTAPLNGRIVEIQNLETTASAARRKLFDTASDGAREHLSGSQTRLGEANARVMDLRKKSKLVDVAASDLDEARLLGFVPTTSGGYHAGQAWIDRAAEHTRQGKDALKELPAAVTESEAAEKSMHKAERAVLEP